jgi:hypothetical protein
LSKLLIAKKPQNQGQPYRVLAFVLATKESTAGICQQAEEFDRKIL